MNCGDLKVDLTSLIEGPLISLLILLVSLIVLDKTSHVTIMNSVKVSEITGFDETSTGFILMAVITSLPELSVSILSALLGEVGISVGNVIGSNVVNVCLIIGLAALFVGLKHSKNANIIPRMAKNELASLYFGLFVASIIPASLIYLADASQLIGSVLLTVFAIYLYHVSRITFPKKEMTIGGSLEAKRLRQYYLLTCAGAFGVIVSSFFLVGSASHIAEIMGIPKTLLGATIIALGTSLPEISISLKAITKKRSTIALGNIVGSCFTNITLILGVVLLASPLRVDMTVFSDLVTFSLIANLFLWYFLTIGRVSLREGAILLFIYGLFLATILV